MSENWRWNYVIWCQERAQIFMLSEISQTQKDRYCDSIYIMYLEWANSQKRKVEQSLPGNEGEVNGQLLFNGYRVSVWDGEEVLEMDSGDGSTIL